MKIGDRVYKDDLSIGFVDRQGKRISGRDDNDIRRYYGTVIAVYMGEMARVRYNLGEPPIEHIDPITDLHLAHNPNDAVE